jgi:two-component system, OmpR family, sensor histidine kinase VicK
MFSQNDQFLSLKETCGIAKDGLIIYSVRAKEVCHTNETAYQLFGLDQGSSYPLISLLEKLTPEDQNYLRYQYLQMINVPRTESEFGLTTKRGNLIICCDAYKIINETFIVLILKDVTKSKQHENYIIEFGTKKNTMLDILIHELSGALSLTKSLLTEVEKTISAKDDRKSTPLLQILLDNTNYCVDIINDLLKNEYSKAIEVYVKKTRTNVVEKISYVSQQIIDAKPNRVKLQFSSPVIYANLDDLKLLQVVNNLVSNAIKFSPDDSTVVLKVEERSEDVIFSVQDMGIGIPESLQPLIFDRRTAAARTGLEGERSIGLGLFISKTLVDRMGGRIWFDSIPGHGSTFYFTLPKN